MIYEVTLTKRAHASVSVYIDAPEHSDAEQWARDQKEVCGADRYLVSLRLPDEIPEECEILVID